MPIRPASTKPSPAGDNPHASVSQQLIFWIVGALVLLFLLSESFVIVQAGERAVVFSRLSGMKPYQLAEGIHFNIPVFWVVTKYDIKTLTYTMSGSTESQGEARRGARQEDSGQVPDDALTALTSDGLLLTLDLSIRFHIDPNNVWRMHKEIGPDFIDKVVRPEARSITRMAMAEFPVTDIYSGKRQVIIDQVQRELRQKFQNSYLVLDEVLLRDIRFPPEFQNAIEQKQVAQQQAEQMVFELQRAGSEKQQKIVEAQGEAGAIRKQAEALTHNPLLIQYEYIKRLPPDVKVIVTDNKAIISLGSVFNDASERKEQ
jgi:regulator of protease activity HflC (stomatin/prohibitin superfamily)